MNLLFYVNNLLCSFMYFQHLKSLDKCYYICVYVGWTVSLLSSASILIGSQGDISQWYIIYIYRIACVCECWGGRLSLLEVDYLHLF